MSIKVRPPGKIRYVKHSLFVSRYFRLVELTLRNGFTLAVRW